MEQFSHDLTAALEETSKSDVARTNGWGVRRRTRSTGNLPCAPQPTEDSSSSPADCDGTTGGGPPGTQPNAEPMLSDSDGEHHRQQHQHQHDHLMAGHSAQRNAAAAAAAAAASAAAGAGAAQANLFGNFESDSLNETASFSPARPNTRRKRKLKRNAVEYETTPSTPGATGRDACASPADADAALDATVLAFGRASVSEQPQSQATALTLADEAEPFGASASGTKKPRPLLVVGPTQASAAPSAVLVRSSALFCGKRKRSHRDRYYEQHSSSVPRHHFQRDQHHHHHYGHHHSQHHHQHHHNHHLHHLHHGHHHAKHSYSEYRSRNRSFSSAFGAKMCLSALGERIAPLTNSIVSKIERIAQLGNNAATSTEAGFRFDRTTTTSAAAAAAASSATTSHSGNAAKTSAIPIVATSAPNRGFDAGGGGDHRRLFGSSSSSATGLANRIGFNAASADSTGMSMTTSVGSPLAAAASSMGGNLAQLRLSSAEPSTTTTTTTAATSLSNRKKPKDGSHHVRKMQRRSKRQQLRMRLQFDADDDDDDGDGDGSDRDAAMRSVADSSSMSSSSDSEAAQRNDTDREGDDELTDWPGNEAMVNFTSKNDFKRAKPRQLASGAKLAALPFVRSDEADDEQPMSADEALNGPAAIVPPSTLTLRSKCAPSAASVPIAIAGSLPIAAALLESEMSGETSTNFLSSPSVAGGAGPGAIVGSLTAAGKAAGAFGAGFPEVREIRAGCRRVRNERPGFTILTSVNEDLSRFLQDARKESLRLPDTDANEHEKLTHLANLYSLSMHGENGYMILTKTKKTMQSVKIDRSSNSSSMPKRFLGDYKRRCYGGTAADEVDDDDDEDDDEDIGDEARPLDESSAMAI